MPVSRQTGSNSLPDTEARQASQLLEQVLYELKKVIVGQENLLERLLLAIVCHGHVLVEGAPGLAKTLTLKSLAQVVGCDFKRIQFTPDLLPADLIGTRIYNPSNGSFTTECGPVFTHFVLADEINRAPAKVQSALLEAMEERQVTVGRETFVLKEPFLVMATQNPIEHEGTYPLPEAQLDRFLFKLWVDYPDSREEMTIVQRVTGDGLAKLERVLTAEALETLSFQARQVYVDPKITGYIVDVVQATRRPPDAGLASKIHFGASPRGSLALTQAAKALALLHGRNYVVPEDVMALIHDCLRHRIILSYEGLASGETADTLLSQLKLLIAAPKLTRTDEV